MIHCKENKQVTEWYVCWGAVPPHSSAPWRCCRDHPKDLPLASSQLPPWGAQKPIRASRGERGPRIHPPESHSKAAAGCLWPPPQSSVLTPCSPSHSPSFRAGGRSAPWPQSPAPSAVVPQHITHTCVTNSWARSSDYPDSSVALVSYWDPGIRCTRDIIYVPPNCHKHMHRKCL